MASEDRSGEFCGARLRLARLLAGFTQKKLGELVDAHSSFLSYVEAGQKQPGSLLVAGFAAALNVDEAYFFLPPPEEFRDEECFFRRRTTALIGARHQVRAYATFFSELVTELEQHFDFPPQNLPAIRMKVAADLERAAELVRMEYGVGRDLPVTSMMRVVENAGVAVTQFPGLSDKVDAFSRYGSRSLIVLKSKSPSRTRWDLAHELAHLLCHARNDARSETLEIEANRFASAFLLPRGSFVREFPRSRRIEWAPLFRLKERWGASLGAIVRRAMDLSLIDANQYRSAYKFMSMKGWVKAEPYEPDPEWPELVPQALAGLRDAAGMSHRDLAKDLGWSPGVLAKVAGLVGAPEPAPPPKGRLVKFDSAVRRAS